MSPKNRTTTESDDLFRQRLENLIDPRHELVRLAERIDWAVFEEHWGALFESSEGRPALPTRLVAGLRYLKHAFSLSDEAVVARWRENPYWQYFCGETYFRHDLLCHLTSLTRWRKRVGEEGVEWMLGETIEAAKRTKLLTRDSLEPVIVDTTVSEKAILSPDRRTALRAQPHPTHEACGGTGRVAAPELRARRAAKVSITEDR